MKKTLIIVGSILGVLLLLYMFFGGRYNSMVQKDEAVIAQWANVESVYQRRADLIPNLVNTVKGYASHEKEVLTGVIEARSKATSINIDPSKLDAASMQKFSEAQSGLSSALSRLLVTVERYPDLKANQNFLELQAQLEGTENRIAVERMRFNEVIKGYNTYIRSFPNNMLSGMYGFSAKTPFKADEGSEKAPSVQF